MPEAAPDERWSDLTTYRILERSARLWPDREGLVSPQERLTYAQLLRRVQGLAAGLHRWGIGPGDHVATLFGTRQEWIILQYALGCLGAVVAPLNTRLQPQELRYALHKVQAKALVTMDRDGNQEFLPRLQSACPELGLAQHGLVESENLPSLKMAVCYSPEGRAYKNLISLSELTLDQERVDPAHLNRLSSAVQSGDPATILFTSGSTGFPKGVTLPHRCLAGQAYHQSRLIRLQPEDCFVNVMPFFHCGGYISGVMTNHFASDKFCIVDGFTAEEILDVIVAERATVLLGFPLIFHRILDLAAERNIDLSFIRKAHMPHPKTWERIRAETGADHLTTLYGLTEGGGIVTMTPLEENDMAQRRDTHGAPLPGVSVRIVDSSTGRELPNGEQGEIAFNGWNRFDGYFGDPELTRSTIDGDGYCLTGDRGYIGDDGYLRFLGRYKEIVKSGGENVSQLEVERFLEQQVPGLLAVSVVGVPDAIWDEAVTAVIEVEPGARLTQEQVQDLCRGGIASFKIPKHVLFMPAGEWPLTGSSKVDKMGLRSWAMKQLGISA